MHHIDPEMQRCIDACLRCYQPCLGMITKLMLACSETCRVTAHVIIIGSPHHKHLCAECADICEDCASECERLGDMDACVRACRECAESCLKMAA